jgi:hypothetical protein
MKRELREESERLHEARMLLPFMESMVSTRDAGLVLLGSSSGGGPITQLGGGSSTGSGSSDGNGTATDTTSSRSMKSWYDQLESNIVSLKNVLSESESRCIDLRSQVFDKRRSLYKKNVYRLHAIVFHRGDNDRPSGGHYYVCVRDSQDDSQEGRWLQFDDDSVTEFVGGTTKMMEKVSSI